MWVKGGWVDGCVARLLPTERNGADEETNLHDDDDAVGWLNWLKFQYNWYQYVSFWLPIHDLPLITTAIKKLSKKKERSALVTWGSSQKSTAHSVTTTATATIAIAGGMNFYF